MFSGQLLKSIYNNNFQGHYTKRRFPEHTYLTSGRGQEGQQGGDVLVAGGVCAGGGTSSTHQFGDAPVASHCPSGSSKLGHICDCLSCQAFQTLMWRIKYINHNW